MTPFRSHQITKALRRFKTLMRLTLLLMAATAALLAIEFSVLRAALLGVQALLVLTQIVFIRNLEGPNA